MKNCLFIIIIISALSCAKDNITSEYGNNNQQTKSHNTYDSYFDWTSVATIPAQTDGITPIQLSLPWMENSYTSIGIPSNWIDHHPNGESLYSRNRGWEMVYSNLGSAGQQKKYFALYNKFTGKMRLFLYSITPPRKETTSTHVGIQINGNVNSFNHYFADRGISSVTNPTIYITPQCSFDFSGSNSSSGIGVKYNDGQWYGVEIDWTYDPTLAPSSYLNLRMWSSNAINGTITETGTGSIKGTITTSTSGESGFDLSMEASKNTTNTITQSNPQDGADAVTKILEQDGLFFNGLWNNIRTKIPSFAGSNIKDGMSALFASNGSSIAKTIGKLFGIGYSGPTMSDIDLTTTSDISLDVSPATGITGWGSIASLPIPPISENIDTRMYNKPLGIYRITKLPTLEYYRTRRNEPTTEQEPIAFAPILSVEYHFKLETDGCFEFNPSTSEIASIENIRCVLVCTSDYFSEFEESSAGKEFGIYKGVNYYQANSYNFTNTIYDNTFGISKSSISNMFKCFLSFDVVNKNTKEVYSFFRYIDVAPYRMPDEL